MSTLMSMAGTPSSVLQVVVPVAAAPPPAISITLLTPTSPHLPLLKALCKTTFGRESVQSQLCPSPHASSSSGPPALPRSYCALTPAGEAIGYACLKRHNKPGRDAITVLHTLCVSPSLRGEGLGSAIVELLVGEAKAIGFDYVYLAAAAGPRQRDLIRFYDRLGFSQVKEPVATLGPAMAGKISESSLAGLSGLMLLRSGSSALAPAHWMQRRLNSRGTPTTYPSERPRGWELCNGGKGLVWERQVGPMCGLTALYMSCSCEGGGGGAAVPSGMVRREGGAKMSGGRDLLALAKEIGLTEDGELYDAADLADLAAASFVGEKFDVWLGNLPKKYGGELLLVPFDLVGNGVGKRGGLKAHWGVVVGTCGEGEVVIQHGLCNAPMTEKWESVRGSCLQLEERKGGGDMNLRGLCVLLCLRREKGRGLGT